MDLPARLLSLAVQVQARSYFPCVWKAKKKKKKKEFLLRQKFSVYDEIVNLVEQTRDQYFTLCWLVCQFVSLPSRSTNRKLRQTPTSVHKQFNCQMVDQCVIWMSGDGALAEC